MSSPEYIAGRIAYLSDELESANPYTQRRDRQEWKTGWQHAKLETEKTINRDLKLNVGYSG